VVPARRGEAGFTLAAMIVTLAVMSVFLTVAVQTATFQRQREMEEELIFRGQQMVEGVRLFRARFGRFPLSLEEMYQAKPRCLRKKWVDPITGKADWVPVFLGQEGQGLPGQGGGPGVGPSPTPRAGLGGGVPSPEARGPIIGVSSRSCESSIKMYEGRSRYCDWKFVFDPQRQGKEGIPPPPPGPQPTEPPLPPKRK
jgi:type II secretory pathway pseudopilin PulG